jgi:DNA-binding response OmpR family regulator
LANKVLVVDDKREIRDLLRTSLSAEGYKVVVASNGEEAIGLAKTENPQVILLDIEMPGIDGTETCKRLEAHEKTRLILIIMMTSRGDRDVEAYLEGANDVVNKPFDIVQLAIRVKSMLRVRHLANKLDRALAYIEDLGKDLPKA